MHTQVGVKREKRVPQNPNLWTMITNLARRKFHPYPSIAASRWVHEEYVKRGGTFVKSKKEDQRHKGGKETAKGKKERRAEEKDKEK